MRKAMKRLRWNARDLWVAAFGYGNVGTERGVGVYLRTGAQLSAAQVSVLVATLNDALITDHNAYRVMGPKYP